MNRRRFIVSSSLLGTSAIVSGYEMMQDDDADFRLTILHTNDWHSRIDPFPMDGGKFQGKGGAAARAALISKIRKQNKHVLVLDAGDMFQGTPYFNFYKGELEIKLMSEMGYDACAIGNHDFDAGVDGLAAQLKHATFPLLCANYDFTGTAMQGKTLPYKIFKKGKLKIGVFGLGIELKGLVPASAYGNTVFIDPVSVCNKISDELKHTHQCDLIICLSHLGYQYNNEKIDDIKLAKQSRHVDLIIGGHTHTFLDKPELVVNASGENVLVNQVGWAGIVLGRIDFLFSKEKKEKHIIHSTEKISK